MNRSDVKNRKKIIACAEKKTLPCERKSQKNTGEKKPNGIFFYWRDFFSFFFSMESDDFVFIFY